MEKFYHGVRRVAEYTPTKAFEIYQNSKLYRKHCKEYENSQNK